MEMRINPVGIFPDTATVLKLTGAQVRKFGDGGSVIVGWHLQNKSGATLKSGGVEISGAEYTAWGTDDTYLLDLVASKVGVTVAATIPISSFVDAL